MSSIDTKTMLAESFITLTENTSPERVSVSDTITLAGKNRKTFYYHFIDKDHLIAWIFRSDLGALLNASFNDQELVWEDPSDDPCSEFPYYVFIKKGVRSLDGADFFRTLASCFEQRRSFYSKVLSMYTGFPLRTYLYRLYSDAIRQDVRFILSNRHLQDKNVDFLAEFYAGAFLSYLIQQVQGPRDTPLLKDIGPFANIVHDSLEHEIKEQQLRRRL